MKLPPILLADFKKPIGGKVCVSHHPTLDQVCDKLHRIARDGAQTLMRCVDALSEYADEETQAKFNEVKSRINSLLASMDTTPESVQRQLSEAMSQTKALLAANKGSAAKKPAKMLGVF